MARRAFPNNRDTPAHSYERGDILRIARRVPRKLLVPERCTRLWESEVAATLMPVPEASVYQYYDTILSKYDIGRARQGSRIQPVSKPSPKQATSHEQLWACVSRPDGRHHPGPRRVNSICHLCA